MISPPIADSLKAATPQRQITWVIPVVTAAISIVIVAAILLLAGVNPVQGIGTILSGSLVGHNLENTMQVLAPMLGMTIALLIPLRARILNLGGDGQLVLGGISGAVVGSTLDLPSIVFIPVVVLVAAAAGAAWAAIATSIAQWSGTPLLVVSLLLSWPALALASYLTSHQLRDTTTPLTATVKMNPGARMPIFGSSLRISLTIIIVVALAAVVLWWIHSRSGWEALLTRHNNSFTEYMGVNLGHQSMRLMVASGAVAGIVGCCITLSSPYRFIDGALNSPLYTWMAFMVVLLVQARPLMAYLGAFAIAALRTGGYELERVHQVPQSVTGLITALVILALAIAAGLSARNRTRGN